MQFPALFQDANALWLFFAVYFLAKYRSVRVKRTVDGVSVLPIERLCELVAVPMLFFPRTHISILATTFHTSRAVAFTGLILVIAGLAFSAWARDVLGRNWSSRIVIQDNHRLITAGPYAYVRHPLYTGLLIAAAGTTLIVADYGAVLGFFFAVARFWLKASREERLLEMEFGPAYASYQACTGALLPRIAHV
jgi:protein-S-isoprenylcysteine O-methyltransferase Ste14